MEKIDKGEVAFHFITNLVVISVIIFVSYEIVMGAMKIIK